MNKRMLKNNSPYSGAITREQFLFHEMRIVAGLMTDGFTDEEIIEKVQKENLFQYPTEKMLKNLASVCIKRLRSMENDTLIRAIAEKIGHPGSEQPEGLIPEEGWTDQLLPSEEKQAAYIADYSIKDGKWHYYLEEAEQEPEVQKQLDEIHREYSALNPEDIKYIEILVLI